MSIVSKILLPCASLSALFYVGCGGSPKVEIPEEPAAAIETVAKELAAGNGGIIWQAMPASYQTDLNSLAQLAGSKVDAEVWDSSFALVGRLAGVVDKQKAFILGSELGGPQPEEQIAKAEAAWPSIVGFFNAVANSSVSTAQGLQNFDGQSFCETTLSELISYSDDLSELSGEELPISAYSGVTVQAIESTDTTAILEMTGPDGEVDIQDFTKVDGRWVPADLADEWTTTVADARAQLEALNPEEMVQNKVQIMGFISMFEGIIDQLEAAETQEQFDQALQGAMMPIMGLMMMQQSM